MCVEELYVEEMNMVNVCYRIIRVSYERKKLSICRSGGVGFISNPSKFCGSRKIVLKLDQENYTTFTKNRLARYVKTYST